VTDDDTLGAVEFVIKVYPQGKMTQVMDKMKVGDTMLMKGPRGRFQYQRNMKRAIGEQRIGSVCEGSSSGAVPPAQPYPAHPLATP